MAMITNPDKTARKQWEAYKQVLLEECQKMGRKNNEKLERMFPGFTNRTEVDERNAWVEARMVEAFDKAVEDLGERRIEILSNPSTISVEFSVLFGRAFTEIMDATDKSILTGGNHSDHGDSMIDEMMRDMKSNTEQLERSEKRSVLPHRAAHQAIRDGDWGKAERIIRGVLEVDEGDVEMINLLFGVGCHSGDAQCIIDARRIGDSLLKEGVLQPGVISLDPMSIFLGTEIVYQFVLAMGGESMSTGGIVLPGPPEPPSVEVIQDVLMAVSKASAEKVHEELSMTADWTPEGFLNMCRRVVTDTCRLMSATRGIILQPWFHGEENPLPEPLRNMATQM